VSESPTVAEVLARADERAARRVLARFLTTEEAGEASWPGKPALERELFRATIGPCDACRASGVLHRFEIHPAHVKHLQCPCDGADERHATRRQWICDEHLNGTHPGNVYGAQAECLIVIDDIDGWCRVAWWLESGHMPWLCPRCWKSLATEELAHLNLIQPRDAGG
jgi:hypothetical protein